MLPIALGIMTEEELGCPKQPSELSPQLNTTP